jgi:pimeloyl-ACP methyl ester carboxylesterase
MNLPRNPSHVTAKRILAPLFLGLLLFTGGCVPNRAYRTDLPTCMPLPNGALPSTCAVQMVPSAIGVPPARVDVPLAFIEFDDVGQEFKRGQMQAAEDVIRMERQQHGDIVTVLFIHGWMNNASDQSDNVIGFRRFLQRFQTTLGETRVVGVYFGWRGATTNAAVIKDLTYFNRRDTAAYIPGSNMSEALLRVARATKGADYEGNSKLVVVGHSFGGLVLERTVTQYFTRRLLENRGGDFQPFADLVVFVNEAAAATEAIQLLTMFHDDIHKPPMYPTIVSITSQGDLATKIALPLAQGASLLKKSLRDYGPPYDADPFGVAKQRTYYLRSAANIPQLQSHVVGNGTDILNAYNQRGYTCASIPSPNRENPTYTSYYVVPIAGAKNDTPYWIMQMPVSIVPNHTDIFRIEFATLLEAFVLRQVQDDPNQRPNPDTCYTDPNRAPKFNMSVPRRSRVEVK